MNSNRQQLFHWMFIFLQLVASQRTNTFCTQQNGFPSSCVPIRNCSRLFELANRINLTYTDRAILRARNCGIRGMVCCQIASVSSVIPTDPPQSLMTLPSKNYCGLDTNIERKIGADRTELDQFRWVIALEYNSTSLKSKMCVGSLINTRYIITVAHCVRTVKPYEVTARLGEWDLEDDQNCDEDGYCIDETRFEKIDRILVHPMHKSRYNDIALLRLESALPEDYTNYILPICLPVPKKLLYNTFSNDTVIVAGWGTIEPGTNERSRYKMYAALKTISLEDCYEQITFGAIWGKTKLNQLHLCAKSSSGTIMNICDSGAPLQIEWKGNYYLIGLMSFGTRCGETLLPFVYTRITTYMDWILENLVE